MSTRDQAGRFLKGAPSPNPLGRASNRNTVYKATRPPGTTAISAFYGNVQTGEANSALTGQQKWVTYSNAALRPVVATGLRYFANLLAGTDWHAEENPAGGKDAARGVEIVRQGLLEAPMLKPWAAVVRKAAMYRTLGFSLHATAMRRRPDGMIVYSAIEHRPQFSIERWLRKSEADPFTAVIQRSRESQKEIEIPLDECFYCVDDTLTDSPEGVGLLRHVIEYVRRLDLFEKWEGHAFESDLNGTPYTRAPLAEIAAQAGTEDASEIATRVNAQTQASRDFMEKRHRAPGSPQWHMLDSSVYANNDGTLTGVPKWAFEIIKGETANLTQMDATIRRVELQIARVLGIEFALMGADGAGSYAQHEDKTSMFATNLQTTLTEMGWFATMQLARRLVKANGLDPDTACPRLVAEPISTEAIEVVTRALANIQMAGLPPDHPALPVLFKRMRLPFMEPSEALADLMARRREAPKPKDDDEDPTASDAPSPDAAPAETDTKEPTDE